MERSEHLLQVYCVRHRFNSISLARQGFLASRPVGMLRAVRYCLC